MITAMINCGLIWKKRVKQNEASPLYEAGFYLRLYPSHSGKNGAGKRYSI